MRQGGKVLTFAFTVGLFGVSTAIAQTAMERLPPGSTAYPIHFRTGSAQLDAGDQDTIRAVTSKLRSDPTLHAIVVGKADAVGSPEFNAKLSEQRAMAVFETLVYTNEAPEDRVGVRWTGEHIPVVSTSDEQEESQNRIAAIVVYKQ